MFKPGDIVFFRDAKKSSHPKAPGGKFKGHGFGLLMGHIPFFKKDPSHQDLTRLLGNVGYLSFDEVALLLGPEMGDKCVKLFTDKYYPERVDNVLPIKEETLDA